MGAGKTTRAHSFEVNGAFVIDADREAKFLMARDSGLRRELRDSFGAEIINDSNLSFEALGRLAFESVESLRTLNNIVHPPLIEHIETLLFCGDKPVSVLDAALIPLWNIESWFDRRIWVDAPFKVRLERLKFKRGDIDERELARRMRLQEEIMPVPNLENWTEIVRT